MTTTTAAQLVIICPDHRVEVADHDAGIAAIATIDDCGACTYPHTIAKAEGPAIIDAFGCIPCGRVPDDLAGYVVAYSHIGENDRVTFTDIAWIEDPAQYQLALMLVREARRKARAGEVDATYAVIHNVYRNGHRHA